MTDESILIINRADVRRLLRWPELLDATRCALVAAATHDTAVVSTSAQLVVPGASLHLKVGAQAHPPAMSVKANLRPDAGRVSGAVLAFDPEQMRLQAILASEDLTAMRTAAIAAVAAQALLPRRPVRLALLGAGPVAQRVYEVLTHLEIVSEAVVWSRNSLRAENLLDNAPNGADASATDDMETAMAGAELVVTCTPSRAPLFEPVHLQSNAVVLAMGADTTGKREVPQSVLDAAIIYTDVREDALRVGESSYLAPPGAERVRELGSVLDLARIAPHPTGGWTVFDSVGSSAVDVVAVSLVVSHAERLGLGHRVQLNA